MKKQENNYIETDVTKQELCNKQQIFDSINNRLSCYYPHGLIPYSIFFDVLQDIAKENGIEIE